MVIMANLCTFFGVFHNTIRNIAMLVFKAMVVVTQHLRKLRVQGVAVDCPIFP